MLEKREGLTVEPDEAGAAVPTRARPTKRGTERKAPAPAERFLTWWRLLQWASIPVAFVILRFVPPRPMRLSHWLLLLVAAALFASPVVLSSYREHVKTREARSAAELAVEYQARLGLTLGEAITPVADLLGQIGDARGDDRVRLQGQLRQRVVDACAELCGPERTRASFFALEGKVMRPVAWAGRTDPPSSLFLKGEPQGDRVHKLVATRRRILVPDTRRPPRGVSVRPDAPYRTFLSVPVYGGTRSFGMLSIDAPDRGALNESDLDIATALAQLLGAGLGRA